MESTRVSVTEACTGVNAFRHTSLNQETISEEFHLQRVSIQPLPLPFIYRLIRRDQSGQTFICVEHSSANINQPASIVFMSIYTLTGRH